jgi:hypothetical protein
LGVGFADNDGGVYKQEREAHTMKANYVFYVADNSFFLWVIKMILSAVLTPLWILFMGLGVSFDFN